jgi:drug/metabolite transporter (DMT)-like permease
MAKAGTMTVAQAAGRTALIGVVLSVAGYYLFNLSDATAKLLVANIPVLQIVGMQFVVVLALTPLLVRGTPLASIAVRPRRYLYVLRALCQLGSAVAFIWAIKILPLADVIAIGFVAPFFITMAAAAFLGETVGRRRWIACAVGLTGALIVLRPGFQVDVATAILPLASALFYAAYAVLTRLISHEANAKVLLAYNGLIGTPVMLVVMPFVWVWPSATEWLGLIAIGLLSALGHLMIIRAYTIAPASLIAPFQYLEITGAALLGWFIFHQFPDAVAWAGIAIIVASGLFVFWRESRLARAGQATAAGEGGYHP